MMDLGKVKEAIDAAEAAMMLGGIEPRDCDVFENGLGAIEYLRSLIAELEKPAGDVSDFDVASAIDILKVNGFGLVHSDDIRNVVEKLKSYHAKKCAECWRVPRVMCSICGDPIIVGGVCENCVPDMFNDDNTPKMEAPRA